MLSSLRHRETRKYLHGLLAAQFGADFVHDAIRDLHRQLFIAWLGTPIEKQKLDFEWYLTNAPGGQVPVADVALSTFADFIPDAVEWPERCLFRADLAIILLFLQRELHTAEPSSSAESNAKNQWRVVFALQEIRTSRGNVRLSLKSISSTLGVSASHLGRLFHKLSGTAFHDYLRAVRMLNAKTLLRSASLPVKIIASTLGYSTECNFCRDFHKAFGMSALSYRQDKLSDHHQISAARFSAASV